MSNTATAPSSGSLDIAVSATPAWAAGHFPGDPILPGASLLDLVIEALREAGVVSGPTCRIEQAKFIASVRPASTVRVQWSCDSTQVTVDCRVGEQRVATSRFRQGAVPAAQGATRR